MSVYLDAFRQCFFIPPPPLTEENLPSQAGRVFIVTGGYAGVGKELCKILYQHNGTVYIAGRSEEKYNTAVEEIKKTHPSSDGRLGFLHLDLADMTTIKKSADDFMKKEQRLDVLTNNAGVMIPPAGSVTAQSHELQLGTNVLGPWFFTQCLTPILQRTAANSPAGTVRVTWAGSLATMFSPKNGITWDAATSAPKHYGDRNSDYAQSKAANVLLAREYQARYGGDGIVSCAWNPGNLWSELQRHAKPMEKAFVKLLCYDMRFGAYTELFAGWSEEAGTKENAGKYVVPWGRFGMLRPDVEASQEAPKLWEWCEKESQAFM